MNTKTYNNENLTAYLLGALTGAESEIFDELSFTDDRFAGELSAAEKDLVDAYVSGELNGEKLKQFESFYLASPLRRERVEFAKTFQTFAEKHVPEKTKEVDELPQKRGFAAFLADIFATRKPLLQWGFALAALLFTILGGWLFRENLRLRFETNESEAKRDDFQRRENELKMREKQLQDEIADQQTKNVEKELAKVREEREKLQQELKIRELQQQKKLNEQRAETQKTPVSVPNRKLNIASFILTPSLRGNGQLQMVSISPESDSVAMQLELEPNDYAAYRVVLKNQTTGQILWRSGRIRSKTKGANKVLNARFPAKLLKSQIYSLEVSGFTADGAAEIISDYAFKVVR